MAEGKQHALSVGVMKMSADSMYKNISLFIFISVALCFSADTDGSNLLHFVFFFFFTSEQRKSKQRHWNRECSLSERWTVAHENI